MADGPGAVEPGAAPAGRAAAREETPGFIGGGEAAGQGAVHPRHVHIAAGSARMDYPGAPKTDNAPRHWLRFTPRRGYDCPALGADDRRGRTASTTATSPQRLIPCPPVPPRPPAPATVRPGTFTSFRSRSQRNRTASSSPGVHSRPCAITRPSQRLSVACAKAKPRCYRHRLMTCRQQ